MDIVPFISTQRRALYKDSLQEEPFTIVSSDDSDSEELEEFVDSTQDSDSDFSAFAPDELQSGHSTSSIGTVSESEESDQVEESGSDMAPVSKRAKLASGKAAPRVKKDLQFYRDDDVPVENDSAIFYDKFRYKLGIDESLPPLSNNTEIFQDMVKKSVDLGMGKVVQHLQGHKLRIGTMCSGTESPILALNRLSECKFLPITTYLYPTNCFSPPRT